MSSSTLTWAQRLSTNKKQANTRKFHETKKNYAAEQEDCQFNTYYSKPEENPGAAQSILQPITTKLNETKSVSHAKHSPLSKNSQENSPLPPSRLKKLRVDTAENGKQSKATKFLEAKHSSFEEIPQVPRFAPRTAEHTAILDAVIQALTRISPEETPSTTSQAELCYMRTCANILDAWRPIIRRLITRLPYRTYVYGGEAYQMYWEAKCGSDFQMLREGPPFRRAMDIDAMVLSNAKNWDEVLADSRDIIKRATHLLSQDKILVALQMQLLPFLHAKGVILTHSPIFTVRSSPVYFKIDPQTGKSVHDYRRMYHTIVMSVHPFLLGHQQRSSITLFELHVQPRCNWNLDHRKLSRAVLGKYLEVTKMSTKRGTPGRKQAAIYVPNVKQMIEHANKVIGNRKPHQVAKTQTDRQRLQWFNASVVDPMSKRVLFPPKNKESAGNLAETKVVDKDT